MVTGQAPVRLEWKNVQGKKRNKPKAVQVCLAAKAFAGKIEGKMYENDMGSQPTVCQVHTGTFDMLLLSLLLLLLLLCVCIGMLGYVDPT